jgi:hypothetical protein
MFSMAGSAAHGLAGADAASLDDGVLAVEGVNVLGMMMAARDAGMPGIPASRMFVQVIEYRQPVFFS